MKKAYSTLDKRNNNLIITQEDIPNSDLRISFKRTLRIPDNNQLYNLPPSLGNFPLFHVEDYHRVPSHWQAHGGLFFPMYQSEAMWINFNSTLPYAIKIAAGKINAVSGEEWNPNLTRPSLSQHFQHRRVSNHQYGNIHNHSEFERVKKTYEVDKEKILNEYFNTYPKHSQHEEKKQDYIVVPKQPWLDGFNVGKGKIRQFVAMPLGQGYTVEEQITGYAAHGGIQIIAYPMKKEVWNQIQEEKQRRERESLRRFNNDGILRGDSKIYAMCAEPVAATSLNAAQAQNAEMGLGAGGFMKQDIYEDNYGYDVWDLSNPVKVFIHIVNSLQFNHITGEALPLKALGPEDYQYYNYPWFNYYDDGPTLEGSKKLAKIHSVGTLKMLNQDYYSG